MSYILNLRGLQLCALLSKLVSQAICLPGLNLFLKTGIRSYIAIYMVLINGISSSWTEVRSGIPQGSVLIM